MNQLQGLDDCTRDRAEEKQISFLWLKILHCIRLRHFICKCQQYHKWRLQVEYSTLFAMHSHGAFLTSKTLQHWADRLLLAHGYLFRSSARRETSLDGLQLLIVVKKQISQKKCIYSPLMHRVTIIIQMLCIAGLVEHIIITVRTNKDAQHSWK